MVDIMVRSQNTIVRRQATSNNDLNIHPVAAINVIVDNTLCNSTYYNCRPQRHLLALSHLVHVLDHG